MSTSLSGLSTNFFPSAQNGFQTTLASTISSGAATVPLNSVAGYTNGQIGVFVVDPTDTTKKQTFTGVIDTAGVQVTSVVWTAGTNQTHTGGATVVDYATATHISMITKGITQSLNQDGSLIGSAVRTALGQVAQTGAGWTTLGNQPNTITANGNRSYTCVFNSVDLTSTLSPGMRLMNTRTVAAPTKSTSLNGTTQYYSKTSPAGMTFTNNFVVSAWVKLSSYATASIASRYNGTSGWDLRLESDGRLALYGFNAGSGNFSLVVSYQSVPLNKWVHVASQLDMSTFTATPTTSYVMFDGLDVPASVSRGGTNPTALIQAGNLEIGSRNAGTQSFPGKIAQVAIYSAKVTEANILATISQGLAGTETSLISAYSFNNSINDLNANANNLTANGSAVATATDSPFGGQAGGSISSTLDYGIITSASFSTNTTLVVQVPEGCTIPTSGGVSAVSYSTVKVPYGFPGQEGKWAIGLLIGTNTAAGTSTSTTYNPGGLNFNLPIGEWKIEASLFAQCTPNTATLNIWSGISTSSSTFNLPTLTARTIIQQTNNSSIHLVTHTRSDNYSAAAATPLYILVRMDQGVTALSITGDFTSGVQYASTLYAKCAHL